MFQEQFNPVNVKAIESPYRVRCLGIGLFKSSNDIVNCSNLSCFVSAYRRIQQTVLICFQTDFNQVQFTVRNKVHTHNRRLV